MQSGKLTVLWDDPRGQSLTLQDKEELFVLRFQSKGGGYKDLTVTGNVTPMLAADKNLAPMNLKTIWSELESEEYSKTTSVYPNPFKESITIEFYSESTGTAGISITDDLGRKIHQWNVDTEEGTNKIAWDGKDINGATLSTGVYIVNVTTSIGVTKVKVVKTM